MRPALIAAAAAVLVSAPALAQDARPAGWFTPWDVYLGCRGMQSYAQARESVASVDPAGRILAFCALGLPRIGARFSQSERQDWTSALANLPDSASWDRVRRRGEKSLLDQISLLGQVSVGGAPLSFGFGSETLSPQQVASIRAIAEGLRATAERITVTGYADNQTGTRAINEAQARKRAAAVVRELVANGIDSTRIDVSTAVVDVPRRGNADQARAATLSTASAPRSLAAPEARQARAGGVDISTLLVGTTDFLISQAQRQVENYLLQQGARTVCADATWQTLLPGTCTLVPRLAATTDSALPTNLSGAEKSDSMRARRLRARGYFPGVGLLHDAIREDLRGLPYRVGDRALSRVIADASAHDDARQRAAVALYLLRYVDEIGRTGTPLQSLRNAAVALDDSVLKRARGMEEMGVVKDIRRAAELASLLAQARADLHVYWRPEVLADSGALYTVKALALNTQRPGYAEVFPGFAGGLSAHVDEVLASVSTAQGLLVSIEREWAQLRRPAGDSASSAARATLVAQILGDAIELASAALPRDSASGLAFVPRLADPVRDLAAALSRNDAPQALSSLFEVTRQVRPGVLGTDELRVLAFTTDIAQARQTVDVQSAFERLVQNGPGYQAKRGSPDRYWRVNAYAGIAAGGEFLQDSVGGASRFGVTLGLSLPVGIEVGSGAGKDGSKGIFVQLVDLGGIASARLTGGSELESFPKFTLGAVVAPGLFYVRSLGGSPFSLLAGAAYVPQARANAAGDTFGGIRVTVGAGVDIPLFP